MAQITLQGNEIHTCGDLPQVGTQAPEFKLTDAQLNEVSLADFRGKKKVLNIFPSIDTPTCAKSTREFNEKSEGMDDVVFLMISADLPFAASRFCSAQGLERVKSLSTFRNNEFANDYGVRITDSAMSGLCARAVIVLDNNNEVIHTQLVQEIADEPDYDAAIKALG